MGGLYLHIPFCRTVCPYCDFAVVADGMARSAPGHCAYVDALLAGLAGDPPPVAVETVYVGGGTPSRLDDSALAEVVAAALAHAPSHAPSGRPPSEVTVEANVEDLDPARLERWRAAGVNRLSVGVQRLGAGALKLLGRARSAPALAALPEHLAAWRGLGGTASVDLIYGLPGDGPAAVAAEAAAMMAWPVDHLSAYALTVEPGTPLSAAVAAGTVRPAQPDDVAACYEAVVDVVEAAGWEAYEVSNFARPGHRARHNSAYWEGKPYLGHGLGAWSMVGGATGLDRVAGDPADRGRGEAGVRHRFLRHRDYGAYLDAPAARLELDSLGPAEARTEALLLGLRSYVGVPEALLAEWLAAPGGGAARRLLDEGRLVVDRGRVTMPPRHRLLAEEVAARWAAAVVGPLPADSAPW